MNIDQLIDSVAYAKDRIRIKLHLSRVEGSFRHYTPEGLSEKQKQARLRSLVLLHNYWMDGKYPVNVHFNHRAPYLIDDYGTYCAMGYLLAQSGYNDLIKQLSQNVNNIYINDVPDESELVDAIHAIGFTKEEAASIQPAYGPCGMRPCSPANPLEQFFLIFGGTNNFFVLFVFFCILEVLASVLVASMNISTRINRIVVFIYFSIFNVSMALQIWFIMQMLGAGGGRF